MFGGKRTNRPAAATLRPIPKSIDRLIRRCWPEVPKPSASPGSEHHPEALMAMAIRI